MVRLACLAVCSRACVSRRSARSFCSRAVMPPQPPAGFGPTFPAAAGLPAGDIASGGGSSNRVPFPLPPGRIAASAETGVSASSASSPAGPLQAQRAKLRFQS